MSKIFIHIGSHKTGTTSIQRACSLHVPQGDDDFKYINVRPSGTKIVHSTGKLSDFRAGVDLEAASKVLRPDVDTDSSAKSPSRYIISDEDFFWISEPQTVQKLAAMLRERFSAIEIICYLRRQDLLAVSHRKQVSEGGGMAASRFYGTAPSPLPKYQAYFLRYFDYASKLAKIWVSAFGKENVTVIPYEKSELVDGDVVNDFSHRTGVDLTLSAPVRANSSLSGDKTLLGLKLSELDAPLWLRRKILRALPGTGTFPPTRQQARDFLAHFDQANQKLASEWDWAGKPFKFSDEFDMYPEDQNSNWTNDGVERMLDAVLASVLSNDRKGLRRLQESRDSGSDLED